MNKGELVKALAERAGMTQKDADIVYNTLVDVITDTLLAGEKVQLVGFGTFEVRAKAAREGINPKTKEKVKIPAVKAPVFKAGKAYKDLFKTEE